jgi:predicted LPLAT superfamily acyltransferase
MSTSLNWLRQRERGNRMAADFMVRVATHLGRAPARALLYPICAYYLASSREARRSIRVFLESVLGRRIGLRDLFRQYHCFASTILDRVYLLTGRHDLFEIEMRGGEIVTEYLSRGQGCLLLGAHLGSFEIVRASALARTRLNIKMLMYEENARMIGDVMRGLDPAVADAVIAAGMPDTMLRVKECLDRGGMVGILGDRILEPAQVTPCMFFGRPAVFPTSPMRLASALKAPVILFFGLYQGGNRYQIHFELFTEEVAINRENRDLELQRWTQRYVDRLQYFCRLEPDNWFNFFDFWGEQSYAATQVDPDAGACLLGRADPPQPDLGRPPAQD